MKYCDLITVDPDILLSHQNISVINYGKAMVPKLEQE